jgi:hypothetical protein
MDTRESSAPSAHPSTEERNCFYCLGGFVFLGSLDHDGEEVYDAIRCRKCDGTGALSGLGHAPERAHS